MTFKQAQDIIHGGAQSGTLFTDLFKDATVNSLEKREEKNYGLGTVTENNGYVIAKFHVMANTKYYLKAWSRNPSGARVVQTHNFTSYVATADSGATYAVDYTINWDEQNITKYRGKREFYNLLSDHILTNIMCSLNTAAKLNPNGARDDKGRNCAERKTAKLDVTIPHTKKRLLKEIAAAKKIGQRSGHSGTQVRKVFAQS